MSPHAYRLGDDGTLEPALDSGESRSPFVALNGAIYLNRVASLRAERGFVPSRSLGYLMPSERSIDVDTEWDFSLADAALCRRSA
jgi:CMP-N,N'-diacetyllegionaminic acid synthase